MIVGLCREGRVDEAREIFDEMSDRNVITEYNAQSIQ